MSNVVICLVLMYLKIETKYDHVNTAKLKNGDKKREKKEVGLPLPLCSCHRRCQCRLSR